MHLFGVLLVQKKGHNKECCQWNSKNPNNRHNEKKEASVNEASA
jgi:hypothetical protein